MKFLAIIILALVISGCADETAETRIPLDYGDWKTTTDIPLDYEIPGHGTGVRMIYINDVGTGVNAATENGRLSYEYPEGTVILKEVYNSSADQAPNNLTVMIKDSENPDARGGWIWLNRNYSSGRERLFKDDFCFACHVAANDRHPYGDGNADREFRDYVFYPWTGNQQ